MDNFKEAIAAIRYRLGMEEDSEKDILADLMTLVSDDNPYLFLYKAPNMSGYEVGYLPNGVKRKHANEFIITLIGVAYIAKVVERQVPGYKVDVKGTSETAKDPRLIQALENASVLFLAKQLYDNNISLVLTKEDRYNPFIVTVEKGAIYHGFKKGDRRAIKAKAKKGRDSLFIAKHRLVDLPYYHIPSFAYRSLELNDNFKSVDDE